MQGAGRGVSLLRSSRAPLLRCVTKGAHSACWDSAVRGNGGQAWGALGDRAVQRSSRGQALLSRNLLQRLGRLLLCQAGVQGDGL